MEINLDTGNSFALLFLVFGSVLPLAGVSFVVYLVRQIERDANRSRQKLRESDM